MSKIGQSEVIKFLEKQKKPLIRSEIAEALKERPGKISFILSKLIEHEEIEYIQLDYKESQKKYGLKRRTKVYFLKK